MASGEPHVGDDGQCVAPTILLKALAGVESVTGNVTEPAGAVTNSYARAREGEP